MGAKLTECEKAERALVKRLAERASVKAAVEAAPAPAGQQHPLRWEAEQADLAVWKAETRVKRACRKAVA
jgi:hypothetical protein